MADFDIDPFGDHESRPEEPRVKIFLSPQEEEDQLGNQNVNKKHHSEEKVMKVKFTKKKKLKNCTN